MGNCKILKNESTANVKTLEISQKDFKTEVFQYQDMTVTGLLHIHHLLEQGIC